MWPENKLSHRIFINQIKDNIDEASAAQALAHKLQGPKQSRSRAYYRVQATRMLTAGSKLDGNTAAKRVSRFNMLHIT